MLNVNIRYYILIVEMKRCEFAVDTSTMKMVMDMLSDGRLDTSLLDMLS